MIGPTSTIVWSDTIAYSIPIRNAMVSGSLVTVKSIAHQLTTGDAIIVSADPSCAQFACSTTVNVVDANTFTFTTPSAPGPFPLPKPGQGILVTATFPDYSPLMIFPERLRLTLAGDVNVQRMDENGNWTVEKDLHASDEETELIFTAKWKVRLKRIFGPIPTTTSYTSASQLVALAKSYTLPIEGANLLAVIAPGTYDIVTVNEYGQIVAGQNVGTGVSYEYSSSASVPSTSATLIDGWSILEFRSAKYQIQITDDTSVESTDVLVIHDGVNVFLSERGNVFSTPASMGYFDALLSDNTISLVYSATTATNKVIRFIRTALAL